MENNYKQVEEGLLSMLTKVSENVSKLHTQILEINKNLAQTAKMGGASSPNELTDIIKKYDTEFKKLNQTIEQQNQQINKLNNTKKTHASVTAEEVVGKRASRKESLLQAQANNKLVGAYQNLVAQQKLARANLRNLIVEQGRNSKETRRAQKEYDKLTKKVNHANKATSNFANTGLGKATSGFRNLLGAFGVIGGITMFAELTKEIFNTTKKMQTLEFSMKTVITDAKEMARAQDFLADISNRYGANLVTLTERYIKFYTAAKQSNFAAKDTQQIFESVTKAAGVLGLSQDELNGTFLALEQMISKGKVSTEELRRQLGERLPGAFGIMANALDVSVEKLDDMLRKGEILSSEALPKFAVALEEAYGIESVRTIDTLAASHERMKNEWVLFIDSLDSSNGVVTKTFSTLLNYASKVLGALKMLNEGNSAQVKSVYQSVFDSQSKYYKDIEKNETRRIEMVKISLANDKLSAEERIKLEKELARFKSITRKEAVVAAEQEIEKQGLLISGLKTELYLTKQRQKENNSSHLVHEKNKLNDLEVALSSAQAAYDAAFQYINKNTGAISENTKETDENTGAKKKNAKAIKLTEDFTKNSENAYRKQIATLEDLRKNTETNTAQWNLYNNMIKILQLSLDALTGNLDKTKDSVDALGEELPLLPGFEEQMDEAIKKITALRKATDDFILGISMDSLDDLGFGSLATFFDGTFDELIDNATSLEEEFALTFNAIAEVAKEAFEFINSASDESFEKRLSNLAIEKEVALRHAGESAEGRAEIEEQFDQRQRAIKKEKAKADKAQALFNIALSTAQGIVAALPNIPLSIVIGALGLAQTIKVASTPIPEFFRGTMNAPEGLALVDEKQPEVHTDRYGNVKSFGEGKANYRHLEYGDKIYRSHEEWYTKEMKGVLGDNGIVPYNAMIDKVSPVVNVSNGIKKEDLQREFSKLSRTINDKKAVDIKIDKNGFYTGVSNGGSRREQLNNILYIKKTIV